MKKFSPIKERIRQYIEYKRIKISHVYEKTGITDGTFSNSSGLSEDNLMKFFSFYSDINPEWLLTGNGNMLKNNTPVAQHTIDNKNVQTNNGNIQQVFNNNKGNSYNHNHTATPASTIEDLKTQIKELNNVIKEKDKVIKMLLEQQSTLINKLK